MPVSPDLDHQSGGDTGAVQTEAREGERDGNASAQDEGHGLGEQIVAGEQEEVQPQKHLKAPDMPSKADIAEHRANGHLPYRSWCPDCVEAFGREWPHLTHGGARSIPLISCDYLFVTPKGIFLRKELTNEERERALKVLVAYCGATGCLFAHAVPAKGVDEGGYIVEQLKNDILWLRTPLSCSRAHSRPCCSV